MSIKSQATKKMLKDIEKTTAARLRGLGRNGTENRLDPDISPRTKNHCSVIV